MVPPSGAMVACVPFTEDFQLSGCRRRTPAALNSVVRDEGAVGADPFELLGAALGSRFAGSGSDNMIFFTSWKSGESVRGFGARSEERRVGKGWRWELV